MVEANQNVYECLKAEFKEEALGSLMEDEKYKETIKKRLKTMFEEGELVRAILDMALWWMIGGGWGVGKTLVNNIYCPI